MRLSKLPLFSQVDFARVNLPSNQLTLKQLRDRFPDRAEYILDEEGARLDAMWDTERLFTLMGYASVLGKEAVAQVKRAMPDCDEPAYREEFMNDLIHYGIADGQMTAKQIVEKLEAAGAGIAREQLGKTP
jgi:hypothetical protein